MNSISGRLSDLVSSVEVVSVTDNSEHVNGNSVTTKANLTASALHQSASVWLAAKTKENIYMEPVKLQGLLALNRYQVRNL